MFKNNNFIERSIKGALIFLKQAVFADEYALKKGFLQSLDPRIKAATFFLFILQALFIKNLFVLSCLYLLSLSLACFSRISPGFFIWRTWVFIPLFSLFIAIPALFSNFSPGETMVSFKVGALSLFITRQGIAGALLFVVRVAVSVSFTVLLSITTRHFELLRVLRIFKIPQIFVMTLGMCYRYVFLFVEIIENTYLAIKSRAGTNIHYKKGQRIVAWNIAYLWQRSYKLNEEVYKAMLSRGYKGDTFMLDELKFKARDWFWLVFVLSISVIFLATGVKI
ncbi:MAG: cobalt ECF transporter T component CbiQ [Candidatus Omnitrophica bacterium]|nr:cobalt ECF transporter T component CbiQ [Candidatus Omnitrophota bacterium]